MQRPPSVPGKTFVIIESPLSAPSFEKWVEHWTYLQECIRHSLSLGEAPFASHQMYTNALDDKIQYERELGIERGLQWYHRADQCCVYTDLGISTGMERGIEAAIRLKVPVVRRNLPDWQP